MVKLEPLFLAIKREALAEQSSIVRTEPFFVTPDQLLVKAEAKSEEVLKSEPSIIYQAGAY